MYIPWNKENVFDLLELMYVATHICGAEVDVTDIPTCSIPESLLNANTFVWAVDKQGQALVGPINWNTGLENGVFYSKFMFNHVIHVDNLAALAAL